jgi:hypothetical protein
MSRSHGYSAAGRIRPIKHYLFENRTADLRDPSINMFHFLLLRTSVCFVYLLRLPDDDQEHGLKNMTVSNKTNVNNQNCFHKFLNIFCIGVKIIMLLSN